MAGFKGYKKSIHLQFNYDEVKKGIPDVNKQMALLDAEFRRASQEARNNGNSMDQLRLKHQHLSQGITLQRDKITHLKQALEQARKGTGDTSVATARYQIDLKNAETELLKMERQQKNINKELESQKGKLGEASNSWQKFKDEANEAGVDVDRLAGNLQKIGASVAGVGVLSAKMFLDFDTEFQKVLTIADETQVSFEDLRKGALRTSRDFGIASGETANALYQILSSGVQTKDALKVLDHTARLAKTGITDMATAGDLLTTIMNTYGLSVQDATKITDQLIITQKVGKNTITQIGQEFGKIAGLAGTLEIPLEEIGAALSSMTKRTSDVAGSMTMVRNIMNSIIQPSEEAKKAAEEYGIQLSVTALKAKGFGGFMEEVVRKTRGNEEALTKLFGNVRSLNGAMLITNEGMKFYKENLEQIKNSTGATDEAFGKISNTASFKLNKALNELKVTAIETGAKFTPFIDILSKFLSIISKIPSGVISTVATLGGLLFVISSIAKVLNTIFGASGILRTAGSVMSVFNGALGTATFATFAKWAVIIIAVVLAITALVIAINFLIGRGREMNSTVSAIGENLNKSQQHIQQANSRAYAIGTTYSQGGRARVHEYGDETIDLPSGSRVYTAEQSRQMMENIKRDDDKIVTAIDRLWSKLDTLENKVAGIPDRQLLLSREMG